MPVNPVSTKGFCVKPWYRAKIGPTGQLTMCCWMHTGTMGNVLETPFEALWDGPVARAVRAAVEAGRLHHDCQTISCIFRYRPRPPMAIETSGWPQILEIDPPSTECNAACIMCPRSNAAFVGAGDLATMDRILARVRHVVPHIGMLHVQGLSEPHWKGLLHRVLDGLGFDDHPGVQVATFTNGSTLDAATRERFLRRVPKSVTHFSIDGATADTFTAIRRLPFAVVMAHLAAFAAERDKARQRLLVSTNVNVLNVGELDGIVRLAHAAGAEGITVNVTDPAADKIKGLTAHEIAEPAILKRFRAAHARAHAAAVELDFPIRFHKPVDLGKAPGAALPLAHGTWPI